MTTQRTVIDDNSEVEIIDLGNGRYIYAITQRKSVGGQTVRLTSDAFAQWATKLAPHEIFGLLVDHREVYGGLPSITTMFHMLVMTLRLRNTQAIAFICRPNDSDGPARVITGAARKPYKRCETVEAGQEFLYGYLGRDTQST